MTSDLRARRKTLFRARGSGADRLGRSWVASVDDKLDIDWDDGLGQTKKRLRHSRISNLWVRRL